MKTKVLRTPQGWIDADRPNIHYKVRSEARLARRLSKKLTNVQPYQYTSLQKRAISRLTGMGIPTPEDIVRRYGYNASVSWGHIIIAGATPDEAEEVISYGIPQWSVQYSHLRQTLTHEQAMKCLTV